MPHLVHADLRDLHDHVACPHPSTVRSRLITHVPDKRGNSGTRRSPGSARLNEIVVFGLLAAGAAAAAKPRFRQAQQGQNILFCTPGPERPQSRRRDRSAARRAFSLASHITQRDGETGMRTRRAAAPSCAPATRDRTGLLHRDVPGPGPRWMIPGWRPSPGPGSPGSPCIRPASRPSGTHPRVPAASGRPGPGSRSPPAP